MSNPHDLVHASVTLQISKGVTDAWTKGREERERREEKKREKKKMKKKRERERPLSFEPEREPERAANVMSDSSLIVVEHLRMNEEDSSSSSNGGGGGGGGALVALVSLNRPSAFNALTYDMLSQLAHVFKTLGTREEVRAAILTGKGDAFSAGIDLTAASQVFSRDEESERENDVVRQMDKCRFPIIGAINGPAVTAGFEIALACDILVASSSAFFMDTHCKFGIMPGWGLSQKLPRLIGTNRAREVAFTSRRLSAREAKETGLVSHVYETREELLEGALGIARRIGRNSKATVENYKKVLTEGYGMTYDDARELERRTAWAHYRKMDPDHFSKLAKFIQSKRKAKL